ncbi:MAG: hypothetical protein HZB38_13550 [Planctomycetes bacterium]|nr:hypothetical protein [Planctomycetota bacterium]
MAGCLRRFGPTECPRGFVARPAVAFACESVSIGTICSSGQVAYTWDAENRLISVAPASTPASGDQKVEFRCDYLRRRVSKKVYTYQSGDWTLSTGH